MADYIIGVDGGQTSVKCVLATTEGRVLARGEGGPLVHLASDKGRAQFVQSLGQAATNAWHAAGIEPRAIQSIGLGLTGVEANSVESKTVAELVPQVVEAQSVCVESDAFAALVGAHLGRPGVIVISGTGSIVLGVDRQGERVRAGGWGWLAGDEGSAVAIGRYGLIAAFDAFDGVGKPTLLENMMRQYLGVVDMRDSKRVIYASDFGARGFAALAPLVAQASEQGDAVAIRIIDDAGRALAHQVLAVVRRLHFEQAPRVAPVGGAFEHITGLAETFQNVLRTTDPPTHVVKSELPPVLGAVILAARSCGLASEEFIANLRAGET